MGSLPASTMRPTLPNRFFTLTAVALPAQASAYAQTATPADAGQLLEQQRRLEAPGLPRKPAEPPTLPPRLPAAQPAERVPFGGIQTTVTQFAFTGSLQGGDTLSNTDVLVLKVTETLAARADVSVDNAGSRSTGTERLNAQLTLNSSLGYGELISLSASKTAGSECLRAAASVPITFPGQDYSAFASFSGQMAGGNLDPSEKFYLGGSTGVRAYPSGEAGGSTGQLISLELRRQLAVLRSS